MPPSVRKAHSITPIKNFSTYNPLSSPLCTSAAIVGKPHRNNKNMYGSRAAGTQAVMYLASVSKTPAEVPST